MKLEVKAPGKLILLGEYAVLEGAPALVAAVDRFARINLDFNTEDYYLLSTPNLPGPDIKFRMDAHDEILYESGLSATGSKQLKYFLPAFRASREYILQSGEILPGCTFQIDSQDFYLTDSNSKLGLGSSAAITVAIIFAIARSRHITPEPVHLFNLALQAHQQAQGNSGSGVDIAASVFGGIRIYRKNSTLPQMVSEPEQVDRLNHVWMIPIWSGQPAVTEEFLQKLFIFKNESGPAYRKIMQRMMELSNEGCLFYRQGNVTEFLNRVHEYYLVLDELGKASDVPIVSPGHRHLAELVQQAGGVYKPSGAGGGDLGIAFCHSIQRYEKIREILDSTGFKIIPLSVMNSGVYCP